MSDRQVVHIIARVTEDNYIQIEGVYHSQDTAFKLLSDLQEANDEVEWELFSERVYE